MRACDDAFREQLEAKEAAHQAHFKQLEAHKQKEVELANRKVSKIWSCWEWVGEGWLGRGGGVVGEGGRGGWGEGGGVGRGGRGGGEGIEVELII